MVSSDVLIPGAPDSALAKAATELVMSCSPRTLANHVLRTYQFGMALAEHDRLNPDRELAYLGAVLHDLGYTERFAGPRSFEVEGADAAATFLRERGASEEDVALVRDIILLHLIPEAVNDPRPEVVLVKIGVSADNFGRRLDDIDSKLVAAILAGAPRLGFKDFIVRAHNEEVRRKPDGTAAMLSRQYDITKRFATAPFDS
ncbi:hypothetical protein GCM10012275_12660 [Longimycelium tulufanense]|uniref:HD/PDEase domain-containing protein n=1 Tax=Longimycelium tulufanense TaxID=907463 RepID=A0A8J3CBH0_9PSEU|nr:HD domain-containing protein [Longimycelium tulufanense]GGM43162.1 hypothetical protein GCM10012275_12660 [Longimycelium tulufanense]